MRRSLRILVVVAASLAMGAPSWAKPVSREVYERQTAELEQLKRAVAAEPEGTAKAELVRKAMRAESDPNARGRMLEVAEGLAGAEREALLGDVMSADPDANLRSRAATALGKFGSAASLATLANAAANDPTTDMLLGDIGGKSNAKRAATFAVAELATRHPAIRDDAVARLRALPADVAPPDREGLADARVQALYQLTRDEALLKPFYDRLKSDVPRDRENGVIAFRFLKLKDVPPEVVAAMKDPDLSVRQWTALILGEIGDPKAAPPLMALAADATADVGVRCNAIYSLGLLKTPAAGELTQRLLSDPDERVQASAAIAHYRITGKKAPQFPPGYDAD